MKTKNCNMLPKMRSRQGSTDNVFTLPLQQTVFCFEIFIRTTWFLLYCVTAPLSYNLDYICNDKNLKNNPQKRKKLKLWRLPKIEDSIARWSYPYCKQKQHQLLHVDQ
jgi:hypothetical protein